MSSRAGWWWGGWVWMVLVMWPLSVSAEPTAAEECPEGQVAVDEARQCCWEGQQWLAAQQRCVGIPAECPVGKRRTAESCVAVEDDPGRAPDVEPSTADVEVDGPEPGDGDEVGAGPDDADRPAPEEADRREVQPPPDDDTAGRGARGPVVTVLGVGGLAGGVVLGGLARSTVGEIDEATMTHLEADRRIRRANLMAAGGIAAAAAGAATLGLGIYLWSSGEETAVTAARTTTGDYSLSMVLQW